MRPVIGVMGAKRSGKNRFADMLVEFHGYRVIAFADPIREALLALNPVIPGHGEVALLREIVEEIGWDEAKEKYPEVRRLMQVFGTEVGRSLLGEDIWIDLLLERYRQMLREDEGVKVVIPDVRFPNEIDLIRNRLGGGIVRINRPDTIEVFDNAAQHESETAWRSAQPDVTVKNDPPVPATLYSAAEAALELLGL